MPVAAVYVRVSTEDQARHGYSLQAQVDACRARAEALGATAVTIFADEGVSGALLTRPGLTAMREAVASGRAELVVVWDPDRLSRNLSHQLLLTEEIEKARVRLEFVNFEWKATAEGQLFYAMRGAIAQYEKEKIRERTGRGRLQKARSGKLPAAFRPYGYEYDADRSLLVPNPAEARVVRDMFRWFLKEGEGPAGIARRLNGLGVPTRRGGPWHRAVVRQILGNPVYAGVFHANRWDTAGCSLNRHRPVAERVSARLRPKEEWIPVTVPPLIDAQSWGEAQGRLERARRLWAGKPRAEYLLSGLLVCGRCSMPMAGFMGIDWGVRRRKYTCRRSRASGGEGGGWCGQALAAEPLEEAVWEQVAGWLAADPAALRGAPAGEPERDRAAEREAVAEALERAAKGRANLLSLVEQGALPAAEAAAALARVGERLAALAEQQRVLEIVVAPEPGEPEPAPGLLERLRTGALASAAERKQLVRLLVVKVTADGRTATVTARWPELFDAKLP